jgi:hypothetical protein
LYIEFLPDSQQRPKIFYFAFLNPPGQALQPPTKLGTNIPKEPLCSEALDYSTGFERSATLLNRQVLQGYRVAGLLTLGGHGDG